MFILRCIAFKFTIQRYEYEISAVSLILTGQLAQESPPMIDINLSDYSLQLQIN